MNDAVDAYGAFTERFDLDPPTAPGTGPLAGRTFAVKELFDVADTFTTAGTEVVFIHEPATHDAPAVARLREAGARLAGRTRSHEFAWGITTRHPRLGGTVNPHDPTRIAGGSSGGSAAAVAAGLVDFALGTDTGGSTRIPAAFCGVVGYKPAYGRIPLDGVVPLAPTLDHVGVLARTVADALLVADIAAGDDPVPLPDLTPAADLRIGVVGVDLELPTVDVVHQTIQRTEALAVHRAMGTWPAQAHRYGDDVRARFEAAEAVTAEEADAAYRRRHELIETETERLADFDAVLLPTAPCGPSTIDDPDHVVIRDGERVPLRDAVMPFTFYANVVGFPAFSVPTGTDDDGMPVGLQLLAVPARARRLAAAAAALAVAVPLALGPPGATGRRGSAPSP